MVISNTMESVGDTNRIKNIDLTSELDMSFLNGNREGVRVPGYYVQLTHVTYVVYLFTASAPLFFRPMLHLPQILLLMQVNSDIHKSPAYNTHLSSQSTSSDRVYHGPSHVGTADYGSS